MRKIVTLSRSLNSKVGKKHTPVIDFVKVLSIFATFYGLYPRKVSNRWTLNLLQKFA